MEKWAFTIKYNPNGLTEDEYKMKFRELITFWESNGVKIIDYIEEDQDKKGNRTKIHVHGTCEIKRGLYRRKLMLENFHVKMVAWRTNDWKGYMTKNLKVKMVNSSTNPQRFMKEGDGGKLPPCIDSDGEKVTVPKHNIMRHVLNAD